VLLQISSLKGYQWPKGDPLETEQVTRIKSDQDLELITKCSHAPTVEWKLFHKNTFSMGVAEKIFFLLTHQHFQFNPMKRVRAEHRWLEIIKKAVNNNQPIEIVYPLLCKIGNWAKQMHNTGSSAGEDAVFLFFDHLSNLLKEIYSPGLHFTILCDARLYNSAFQNSSIEVHNYINCIQKKVSILGLESLIDIFDYSSLLEKHVCQKYLTAYWRHHHEIHTSPRIALQGIKVDTLRESVKCSMNTRRLGMSYSDHRDLFSSAENTSNCFWDLVNHMADVAFQEVVATRKACADVNIFDFLWPDALRVTCHRGDKKGLWQIGLRPYPQYYNSSKLLPFHGIPLVRKRKKGKLSLEIHPEIVLRSNSSLVRVLKESGSEEVYFYDGSHLKYDDLSF